MKHRILLTAFLGLAAGCSPSERAEEERAADLSLSSLGSADLAPSDTVFFANIPSLKQFNQRFSKYHEAACELPVVREAIRENFASPVLAVGPSLPDAPLAAASFGVLAGPAGEDLFLAMRRPVAGGAMRFLAGGRSADAREALEHFRTAAKAKEPALNFKPAIIAGAEQALEAQVPGAGLVQIATARPWLLVGTDTEALAQAVAACRSGKAVPSSLAGSAFFRANAQAQTGTPSLSYFTDVRQAAALARALGDADLANLLAVRTGGLETYSWSWNTAGPESDGFDRFVVTLDAATAEQMGQLTAPLSDRPRSLVGDGTLVSLAVRFDPSMAFRSPALAGLGLQRFAGFWEGLAQTSAAPANSPHLEVQYLVDAGEQPGTNHAAWLAEFGAPAAARDYFRTFVQAPLEPSDRAVQVSPGRENSTAEFSLVFGDDPRPWLVGFAGGYLMLARDEASLGHFAARAAGASDVVPAARLITIGDAQPQVDSPFLDLRLDFPRIVSRYLAQARANYSGWAPVLRARGLDLPAALPEIDVPDFFGVIRLTSAHQGRHLIIQNAIDLQQSGSSMLTPMTALVVRGYGPELLASLETWQRWFRPDSSASSGDASDNLFNLLIWSNFLAGPLVASNHASSVFVDLFSVVLLADPPPLPLAETPPRP